MSRTILDRVGDKDPILHGGGVVLQEGPNLVLEYTPGLEATGFAGWRVPVEYPEQLPIYRVDLKSSAEEFLLAFDWVDWHAVANFSDWPRRFWNREGTEPPAKELDGPLSRALVIISVAFYYSWGQLDEYPLWMEVFGQGPEDSVVVLDIEERWGLD